MLFDSSVTVGLLVSEISYQPQYHDFARHGDVQFLFMAPASESKLRNGGTRKVIFLSINSLCSYSNF